MSKRKAEDFEDLIRTVKHKQEDNWVERFLELEPHHITTIIGRLADRAKINSATLAAIRDALDPFSDAKWDDLAERFHLNKNPDLLTLPPTQLRSIAFHNLFISQSSRRLGEHLTPWTHVESRADESEIIGPGTHLTELPTRH